MAGTRWPSSAPGSSRWASCSTRATSRWPRARSTPRSRASTRASSRAGRGRVRRDAARHALGPGRHRRQHDPDRDRPRRHPVHAHRERVPVGLRRVPRRRDGGRERRARRRARHRRREDARQVDRGRPALPRRGRPPDLHARRDRAGAVRAVRDPAHARVRHDARDARVGRGEEPLQRRARPVRALPERDHDRRRARSRRRCVIRCTCSTAARRPTAPPRCCSCSAERAHEFTDKPVFVAGFGVATDHPYLHEKDSFTEIKATRLAAQRAYAMAGVGPSRSTAPRCTTASRSPRSSTSKTSASSRRATAAAPASRARPSLTGRIPVNTSGGLLAKGHPIGATGVAQITECWWQLRGEAGERQVETRNGYALQHNVGGRGSGVSVVNILTNEREPEADRCCASRRRDDGVGRIVLDRPEAKNALTDRDARRHHRRGARVPRRPGGARGPASPATGDAFCAGMDLERVDGRAGGQARLPTAHHLRGAARGRADVHPRALGARQADGRGGQRRRGRARARTSRSRATSCSCTRAPASCGRSPSGASSSTPAARTCSPASSACRAPRRW